MEDFLSFYDPSGLKLGTGVNSKTYGFNLKRRYENVVNNGTTLFRRVALKMTIIEKGRHNSNPNEGAILSSLASPGCLNIVKYLRDFSFPVYNGSIRGYCIVMEACQGTFRNLIKSPRLLNIGDMSMMSRQVMEALAYLENKAILHNDIVPWNLLLKTNPTNLEQGWEEASIDQITVQLGDFGSACKVNQRGLYRTNPREKGCTDYLAPEIISTLQEMHCPYSHNADIYSAAMCLIELYTKGIVGLEQLPMTSFTLFISPMLSAEPADRPKAGQVIKCHGFMLQNFASKYKEQASLTYNYSVTREDNDFAPTDYEASSNIFITDTTTRISKDLHKAAKVANDDMDELCNLFKKCLNIQ